MTDRLYSLDEVSEGYKCPLCPFVGLPFPLYAHLQEHFNIHVRRCLFYMNLVFTLFKPLPNQDEVEGCSDTDAEPPFKKVKVTTSQPPSKRFPSSPAHKPWVNNFSKTPSSLPSSAASQPTLVPEEPATPTPILSVRTPPTSLHHDHHLEREPVLRTSVKAELNTLRSVVVRFLERHKETCMLHTILLQTPEAPHTSLLQCDLQRMPRPDDYNRFRSVFRSANNTGRCHSCGCPKLEGVLHNGPLNGSAKTCRDEGLQDWIIGLSYYIWQFVDLRRKVFHLLGVHFDAFGQDDKGRDAYALWLGERSGRHASYIASNLLDMLFVVAQNAVSLFGQFESDDTV